MTNEATDHSAAGHTCAHCDSPDDHHTLDEKGIVDAFRASMSAAGTARAFLVAALTVSAVLWAPLGLLAGAAAWVAATAAGLVAVSATSRAAGQRNALVFGTVASAAALPLLAWATAAMFGGDVPTAAAGASGWFLATAAAEILRDRKLSALLIADSRDAEAARQGVLFGNPLSPWVGLAWSVVTAAFFGAWTWVTGVFPLALLPLIPLQVVLALFSRRGRA